MSGFEMFCERCGKRYGGEEATAASALPRSKRLLQYFGVGVPPHDHRTDDPVLRFCLACRGYSCPDCWNEEAGFCQTCVPLPEPPPMPVAEPVYEAPAFEPALAFAPPPPAPSVEPVSMLAAPIVPLFTDHPATPEYESMPVVQMPLEAPQAQLPDEAEAQADVKPAVERQPGLTFDVEADADLEPAVLDEPLEAEAEPVLAVAEVAAEAPLEEEPVLGMVERPLELVFADEESYAEPEAEAEIDWQFAVEVEAEEVAAEAEPVPLETEAEPVAAEAEPVAVAVEFEPVAGEAEPELVGVEADSEPVAAEAEEPPAPPPAEPFPAPVFIPLPPLGPIMPPPPPPAAAAPIPRMVFDLPLAPPAFVIAPPQPPPSAARPILPAGLFDGPGPTIRPCSTCELPVSAKARFCRRCGSAQEITA